MPKTLLRTAALALAVSACAPALASAAPSPVDLDLVGRTLPGGEASAEIAAFDPVADRVFVTDGANNELDAFDFSNPALPTPAFSVDLSPYGAGPNSVAYSPRFGGIVAVAIEDADVGDPGTVQVFDTAGNPLESFTAGPLPDMLTFALDGDYLLVANEGEPADDGSVDPEGSVTVIDLRPGLGNAVVSTAGFAGVPLDGPVRIFTPGATTAEDLEPEYITSAGNRAYVSIQEANAIGILDIPTAQFQVVRSLGFKDHGVAGAGIDASDQGPNANTLPHRNVFGMYQPDAISAYPLEVEVPLSAEERQRAIDAAVAKALAEKLDARVAAILAYDETQAKVRKAVKKAAKKARRKAERAELSKKATKRKVKKAKRRARERALGELRRAATDEATAAITAEATAGVPQTRTESRTYVATANEGDARDYSFFSEESRVSALSGGLEASMFEPNASSSTVLGRLTVTETLGNTDADPAYEELYAFGARSMSILDVDARMVDDTGDELEQLGYVLDPANYNKDNEASAIDNRSDNKGPEPEAVDTGQIDGRTYAFVAAERSGGIYAYDLTSTPGQAEFAGGQSAFRGYINTREADLGPEGLQFVEAAESPTGSPMLLVTYEISGTVAAYSVSRAP